MLVTKKWYMSPITYEDEKYTYTEDEKGRLYLIDKKTGTIIFEEEYLSLIKQIKNYEFIIIDVKNAKTGGSYPERRIRPSKYLTSTPSFFASAFLFT